MSRVVQTILPFFLCIVTTYAFGQPMPDNVKQKYLAARNDSAKGMILDGYLLRLDKEEFHRQTAALSEYFTKAGDETGYDFVRLRIYGQLAQGGDYAIAIPEIRQLLSRFEKRKDALGTLKATVALSVAYAYANDEEQTIYFDKKAVELSLKGNSTAFKANTHNNIASDFVQFGKPDSALPYAQLAVKYARESKVQGLINQALSSLGEVYIAFKQFNLARPLITEAMSAPEKGVGSLNDWIMNDFGEILIAARQPDSARFFLQLAIKGAKESNSPDQLQRGYNLLSRVYEMQGRHDSALISYRTSVSIKDSLFSSRKTRQLQAIKYEEQLHLQQMEQDSIRWKNKMRTFGLIGGLLIFTVIALILYRNNRQKQRVNRELEKTLSDLKATQAQLVQSEKMASLGELTAGIAHEIQNPLNFVNNFSEVNRELAEELELEIEKGNYADASSIAKDIRSNEEKINHHGKRADAIVKGMLQHSRSSSGKMELTDINNLCDEYLRLSYHGLRAKDKTFNATLATDFDPAVGSIPVLTQDMGRVVLNLLTNAFYAVNEKKQENMPGYDPKVTISTTRTARDIRIRVADNGNGIPEQTLNKIFQPFFTTKPTGQGTGLGLSLSYDIIRKGHGGDIEVETKEGEGTTFTIILPIKTTA